MDAVSVVDRRRDQVLRRPAAIAASVDRMTEKPTPKDVDAFLDSTVIGDDPALAAALESSNAAGLPPIAVSWQQGKFLSLLATATAARRGCSGTPNRVSRRLRLFVNSWEILSP